MPCSLATSLAANALRTASIRPRNMPGDVIAARDWSATTVRSGAPEMSSCAPGCDADHALAGDVGLRSRQRQGDGVDDERRLPRPGHAAHADLHAERDADVEAAQVVLACAGDVHPPRRLAAAGRGAGSTTRRSSTARVTDSSLVEVDDAAARASGTRADLDDVVGGANERGVVLDGDDGVAGVAQLRQGARRARSPRTDAGRGTARRAARSCRRARRRAPTPA